MKVQSKFNWFSAESSGQQWRTWSLIFWFYGLGEFVEQPNYIRCSRTVIVCNEVRDRLRYCITSRKVAGSILDGAFEIFHL
jgi:hypothetical protein